MVDVLLCSLSVTERICARVHMITGTMVRQTVCGQIHSVQLIRDDTLQMLSTFSVVACFL